MAGRIIERLQRHRPGLLLGEVWRDWVAALDLDPELREQLNDPERLDIALTQLAEVDPGLASHAHATTRATWTPTVIHGGRKTNVLPDRVVIELDMRTLPGQEPDAAREELLAVLGELAAHVTLHPAGPQRAATASARDTRVYRALADLMAAAHDGATVVPMMATGGTDAAFFRRRGVPSYGAGLMSARTPVGEFRRRFHGDDERIDITSLGLSAQFWVDLAARFGG